jgi:30S ribosomal protein 3
MWTCAGGFDLSKFVLLFLCCDKDAALAVDQVVGKGTQPIDLLLFLGPWNDAWEQMKTELEAKHWISLRSIGLELPNKATEVNYWRY